MLTVFSLLVVRSHLCVCVRECACVLSCVRACVRACVCMCVCVRACALAYCAGCERSIEDMRLEGANSDVSRIAGGMRSIYM